MNRSASLLTTRQATRELEESNEAMAGLTGIGQFLRTAHRLYARVLQQSLQQKGLNLGIWYFLRTLWEEDGITQRELSRRMGAMEPTTVTALGILERRGLVERHRDQKDRRRRIVRLTEKGRKLRSLAGPLTQEIEETAAKGIPAKKLRDLLEQLAHIRTNLENALEGKNEFPTPRRAGRGGSAEPAKHTGR